MAMFLSASACVALLVVNVLLFGALVPLQPGHGVEYLLQMAVAVLLVPVLVLLGMLSRPRLRRPRLLLRGALAGLAGSLVLSAASVALSPPAPRHPSWNAVEKQAHLEQTCRNRCADRGTDEVLCQELCSCTVEALFSGRSDEELARLTVEGPYGRLSKEVNQLLGELGAECAAARRAGGAASGPPS